MITARPHCCEEAAIGVGWGYLPCNKPATWIVIHHGWQEIAMCTECAWHNLKNRGAIGARPYDPSRYTPPAKLNWHIHDSIEATPLTPEETTAWVAYYAPPPDPYEVANKRWKAARLGVAYGMGEIKGGQILGQYPLPDFDQPLGELDL